MPATLDTLSQDALALPSDQRLVLAYRLLANVEPAPDPDTEAVWEAEIARRMAEAGSGEVESIPAAEVFAHLRGITSNR